MRIHFNIQFVWIWIKNILMTSMNVTVSEWLLLTLIEHIFQLYHGENKLHFDEMMMRSALY
jgi:hypothetical protein